MKLQQIMRKLSIWLFRKSFDLEQNNKERNGKNNGNAKSIK